MSAPAAAFQVPVSKEQPSKRGLRSAEIADILGLGKSRRNVTRKGSKLVRAWGGQWDADDVGQLFRRNDEFASMFLFMLGAANESDVDSIILEMKKWKGGALPGAATGKEVTWLQYRQAVIEFIFRVPTAGRARSTARALAKEIADAANMAKVHAYTMLAVVMGLAHSQAADAMSPWWSGSSTARIALRDSATGRTSTFAKGSASDVVSLARTFRRAASRLTLSASPVFAWARKAIASIALYAGYYTGRGLRAWTGRGTRPIGVEVVSVTYEIPNKFDEDGSPLLNPDGSFRSGTRHPHESAAIVAERKARGDEQLRGLLDLTPAGRIYLCAGQDGRGIFLGSDRRPSRKVFLVNEYSPRDAVLHGYDVNGPVSGFVF